MNEINKFMHILSESEKIEKSNDFITDKVMKLLRLRGHFVDNSYNTLVSKNASRLEEYILIDNKYYIVFYHDTQEFYYMDNNGGRFLILYKTPMDVVRYLHYICL